LAIASAISYSLRNLIPQFLFMSAGVSGAFLYLIRLKNNPEPWNNLGPTYQYKVNSPAT
uniref:Uncharacterized protein n=1 Tax=Sinocyclocheilus anshuiensis TaxID=1608454 RepID=A0A671Q7M1_9TELE